MSVNKSFSPFRLETGQLFDYRDNEFPTRLHAWNHLEARAEQVTAHNQLESTFFGYVFQGEAKVATIAGVFTLKAGMYFAVPAWVIIEGGAGILIERLGYTGQFQIGGPIECDGRLRYIDGCTDSLLVAPVKFGDPCLNALYFPQFIKQTAHTHPSMRVGIVASGRGECVTPEGNIPLFPGQVFIIHQGGADGAGIHSFRTEESPMVVIAYHPDSDFGPRDEEHPMINRTIVNGVSARYLDEIRTQ